MCYCSTRGSSTSTSLVGVTKKRNAKDRRTGILAPSHHPPDERAQTRSWPTLHEPRDITRKFGRAYSGHCQPQVTITWQAFIKVFLATNEPPTDKTDLQNERLEKWNIDNCEECMVLPSLLQNPICPVLISIWIYLKTYFIVASLLESGASPNLVKISFLPQNWEAQVKTLKNPSLKAAAREAVPTQGLISIHIRMGDIYAGEWFGNVEKLAVDQVLGTSVIDSCMHDIFPAKRKVVPINSCPKAIHKL